MKEDIEINAEQKNIKNEKEIIQFIKKIDNIFPVPISKVTDIEEYTKKLLKNGIVITSRLNGQIIGIIAGYANDEKNWTANISILGVDTEHRGSGSGSRMTEKFIEICEKKSMKKIKVNTKISNKVALFLYQKKGFKIVERKDEIFYLEKYLCKEKESALVTAIGSFSADITIKELRKMNFEIIGCDIYPKEWIADSYNVDFFEQAPKVYDKESYLEFIKKIVTKYKIKYIVPLTDPEVDLLSQYKEEYSKKGISICTSSVDTIKKCRDKYQLPEILKEISTKNIINTELLQNVEINNINLPIIVKPYNGRSSENLHIFHTKEEVSYYKQKFKEENMIVQPYIKGNIITVDVLSDLNNNNIVAVGRRELLRTGNGAGTTVQIIENKKIEEFCKLVCTKLKIEGCVNFEFIETEENFYFLEINPRFSGGIEFTNIAGYNMIKNHMNFFMKKDTDKKDNIKKLIIARKYEEYVME